MAGSRMPLTEEPCPVCRDLAVAGRIRPETVQRLPEGAFAPMSRAARGVRVCFDCAAAEGLLARVVGMDFEMARIAVGNDRQEQYRLPGAPMGLVQVGAMRSSEPGDLEDQHAWLDRQRWFDIDFSINAEE